MSSYGKKAKSAWDDNTQAPSGMVGNPFAGARMPQGFGQTINKAGGDISDEWGRTRRDPTNAGYIAASVLLPGVAPLVAAGAGARGVDRAGGMAEIEHDWNRQLSPRYAKNYRQDRRRARNDANTAARMQRQDNYFSGLAGGGAGVSSEIEAYNSVIAQFAAQQQALKQQNSQNTMQSLGSVMQLLAMLYGGGGGGGMPPAAGGGF